MITGNTHRVEAGLAEKGFDLINKNTDGPWVGAAAAKR
jgi:hypothetical protein